MRHLKALVTATLLGAPVTAFAQTRVPAPAAPVPAAQPAPDPAVEPPSAAPTDANDLVEQAMVHYANVGVFEVGGSAGLAISQDIHAINLSPSVGWFIADNLEMSAILDVSNLKAGNASATLWSALAEPSFHTPFNDSVFG